MLTRLYEPVQPTRVRPTLEDLDAPQQINQERPVRRPTRDEHPGLSQRATEAGERFISIAPPGDDLGDFSVAVRWHDIAEGHGSVDAQPRTVRQLEQGDRTRRGRESSLGVLGAEMYLDRVPPDGGHGLTEPVAGGDPELELHQVDASRDLGHRVLVGQTRIESQESERTLVRMHEELDGSDVAIVGRLADGPGRVQDLPLGVRVQRG